ncbi:hypothetical protein K9L27_01885 [Candidatus Gracilibacteria bacterium]|nr:hypothetical protein [Candidatus Gracilibacteria bacterium]
MKKLFAFSFVATKFMLLACFGLMNVGAAEAKVPVPCHQEMVEKITSQDESRGDCQACVLSEKAWSSQFVQEKLDFLLRDIVTAQFVSVDELLNTKFVQYVSIDYRSPPDDLRILHSHLIAQASIVLVI